jgi:hypothetical protein
MNRDCFGTRVLRHDEYAIPLVVDTFKRYGFYVDRYGVETGSRHTWQLLASQRDMLALMLRFRPDIVGILPRVATVLCEVKSQTKRRDEFFVEFDSWLAARQWDRAGGRVMYALVDLSESIAYACWVSDVEPSLVIIPKRFDYEEQRNRIIHSFPWVAFRLMEHTNGSGTPFFAISKHEPFVKPLDDFIIGNLIIPNDEVSFDSQYPEDEP